MSKASDKKAKATKSKPKAVSAYKQAQSKPTTTPMHAYPHRSGDAQEIPDGTAM